MLFCMLNGERKYYIYINVTETFSKKESVTSFVGQAKKESMTYIMGRRDYILLISYII